jgi:Asp-tRNA(Asn)/Glu-tRNA(Gln) amidotransferase A subunit family amidase
MTPLHELTATGIVAAIYAGKTTAVAVAESCLAHIELRELDVQAWTFLDPELVLQQAHALDKGGQHGALQGVPIGLKDIIDTADMPTELGTPIHQGRRPTIDAACTALTRRAGGLIMGKTVTTEFANRFPGKTRNPHDASRTPGGSSRWFHWQLARKQQRPQSAPPHFVAASVTFLLAATYAPSVSWRLLHRSTRLD